VNVHLYVSVGPQFSFRLERCITVRIEVHHRIEFRPVIVIALPVGVSFLNLLKQRSRIGITPVNLKQLPTVADLLYS